MKIARPTSPCISYAYACEKYKLAAQQTFGEKYKLVAWQRFGWPISKRPY